MSVLFAAIAAAAGLGSAMAINKVGFTTKNKIVAAHVGAGLLGGVALGAFSPAAGIVFAASHYLTAGQFAMAGGSVAGQTQAPAVTQTAGLRPTGLQGIFADQNGTMYRLGQGGQVQGIVTQDDLQGIVSDPLGDVGDLLNTDDDDDDHYEDM